MAVSELEASVGQLVRKCPSRSRVFERLSIDYCCGGQVSLLEACQLRDLDPDDVLKELHQCENSQQPDDSLVDVDAMGLTELADHIQETHHAYLKTELPRLDQMTKKVAGVHGEREPRLQKIREAFVEFRNEIEPHMMKEERVLFPMIRQLDCESDLPDFHCGTLTNPIRQMEHEHDQAGETLARMRSESDGFVPPQWACNTYRAMLDGLAELEQDMHQHIHKENNVLFPKTMQLEDQRRGH